MAASRTRPGFTLIEGLVVIAMIITLLSLVVAGLNVSRNRSRIVTEQQTLLAIKVGAEAFQTEFGFPVPLVDDQDPIRNRQPNIVDNLGVLRGETGVERQRYSLFSIPYYLMGLLDVTSGGPGPIDGAAGPKMRRVERDGSFAGGSRVLEAFYQSSDPKRIRRGEDGQIALVDFWGRNLTPEYSEIPYDQGDPPVPHAVRYYRWEPDQGADRYDELNIPSVLGDATGPEGSEIRAAKYAIVSAGPDGLFGENDPTQRADNIVEVGR